MNIKSILFIFSIALIFQIAHIQAFAAGGDSDSESSFSFTPSSYDKGKREIESKNYQGALTHLKKAIEEDGSNANAYNLLGYSFRKLGQTEQALFHYKKALAIKPNHLGANEYLGELYLETGQLQKAEERLEVLDKACFFRCAEYDDLKMAIEKYKSQKK